MMNADHLVDKDYVELKRLRELCTKPLNVLLDEARDKAVDDVITTVRAMWEPGGKHSLSEIVAAIRSVKGPTP